MFLKLAWVNRVEVGNKGDTDTIGPRCARVGKPNGDLHGVWKCPMPPRKSVAEKLGQAFWLRLRVSFWFPYMGLPMVRMRSTANKSTSLTVA